MAAVTALLGAMPARYRAAEPERTAALAIAWPAGPVAHALRQALETGGEASPEVAAFYRARGYRPLWVKDARIRPEADEVVRLVASADADGLDPARYGAAELRKALDAAREGNPRTLARAELALSRAYGAYVADLHRPPPAARMAFWDPALASPQVTPRAALEAVASTPHPGDAIDAARRMHPIYQQLRSDLATRGAHNPLRPLILANMGRARALPADPGGRYILVDAAAQRLWLYEDGQAVDSMRVIIGARSAQTPAMAGLARYVQFRPYWNVPPDITRDEIAPRVLREGLGYLAREDLQVLSGWSPDAAVLDPDAVDWAAVAAGAVMLRVRRLPGAQNILGQVKLMLPNPLGIYLHDTPNKAPFAGSRRTLSHGCVRLEDAMRLTRRLVGPAADDPPPGDDVRVDLPSPTPVYIVYFTLAPGADGLERRPDIYGRDTQLLAQVVRSGPARSPQARRRPAQA